MSAIHAKLPIDSVKVGNSGHMLFSAVVTLYNEEGNVEPLTRHLISAFRQQFIDQQFELILVLNGPQDRTPAIAQNLASEFREITLVTMRENQGYGGGLLAGLSQARGEYVGYTDGDEQIDSQDVAKIFAAACAGSYDLVKVSRTVRQDGWQRLVVSSLFNLLFRLMFGGRSTDINGKPKVFRRSAFERLNLTATDWFLDAELMIQAQRLGLSMQEIPAVFKQRQKGASNVRLATLVEFLRNMWEFRNAKS